MSAASPAAPFSVPAFLEHASAAALDGFALEGLARKVDVAKRLHELYDAQLRAPASPKILDAAWLPALGTVFLDAAERTGDLKWLNTALKLQDGVLLEPAFAGDRSLQERIERLLAKPLPPCRP